MSELIKALYESAKRCADNNMPDEAANFALAAESLESLGEWIPVSERVPSVTADDPRLNRQLIVDSSWGVRAAYFQHDWGIPHFQDVNQRVDEGKNHEDKEMHDCRFSVYRWKEMPKSAQ